MFLLSLGKNQTNIEPFFFFFFSNQNVSINVYLASKRKRSTGDEERDLKRIPSDRTSNGGNNTINNNITNGSTSSNNTSATSHHSPQEPQSRKSSPSNSSNNSFSNASNSQPTTNTTTEKEKPTGTGSTTRRGRSKRLTIEPQEETCDNDNEPEKKFTLSQMYQSYFTLIHQNRFSNPKVHAYVNNLAKLDRSELDESTSYLSKTEFNSIELPSLTIKLTTDHPKQKFSGFSRFGLFVDSAISRERFIIEYVGLIMTKEEYKCNAINQYRHFGVPKPGVMFHPSLQIAIDGRQVGSISRFIRRSCRPNCKVSTVIVDNSEVLFVVFALEPLKPGVELTVAWEWDEKHPARKLLDESSVDQLSKEDRTFLVHSAEMIQQRGSECACNLPQSECLIGKMKKALGNPSRVTRTSAKTRRGGMLDGTNSLLDENDSRGNGSQDSDEMPAISFYSKREARKLQSAMALFDKISNQPPLKKRKNETPEKPEDINQVNESEYQNKPDKQSSEAKNENNTNNEAPETDSKDETEILDDTINDNSTAKPDVVYVEKSTQTHPLIMPLRKNATQGNTNIEQSNPIHSNTNKQTPEQENFYRNRLLQRYLNLKRSPSGPILSTIERSKSKDTEFQTQPTKPLVNSDSQVSILASKILGRALPATIIPPQESRRRSNGYRQVSGSGPNNLSRTGTISHPFSRSPSSPTISGLGSNTNINMLLLSSSAPGNNMSSPPLSISTNNTVSQSHKHTNGSSTTSYQQMPNGTRSNYRSPSTTPLHTPKMISPITGPAAGIDRPESRNSSNSNKFLTKSATPTPSPSPANTPRNMTPPPFQANVNNSVKNSGTSETVLANGSLTSEKSDKVSTANSHSSIPSGSKSSRQGLVNNFANNTSGSSDKKDESANSNSGNFNNTSTGNKPLPPRPPKSTPTINGTISSSNSGSNNNSKHNINGSSNNNSNINTSVKSNTNSNGTGADNNTTKGSGPTTPMESLGSKPSNNTSISEATIPSANPPKAIATATTPVSTPAPIQTTLLPLSGSESLPTPTTSAATSHSISALTPTTQTVPTSKGSTPPPVSVTTTTTTTATTASSSNTNSVISSNTSSAGKPMKKKLSFADYKKKQQKSTTNPGTGNNSNSTQ